MIISGWHIDGYGVHRGQRAGGLDEGACVVYGPNEAGKSTLLGFLRYVLFGRAASAPVPALRGGRPGGRVFLRDAARAPGTWTVERLVGRRTPTVLDPTGRPAEPEALGRLLGGVDAGLFGAVFAFSLAELSRFESLSGGAVRDQIFSAGITGAGITASQARRRLEGERLALLRPRTTRARINGLLAELRRVRERLAEAEHTAASHGEVLRDETEAGLAVERLAGEIERLRHEQRLLDALQRLWEPWNRWREACARLAAMPRGYGGSGASASMAQARRDRDVAAQRLSDHERGRDEARRLRDGIEPNPALEAVAGRLAPCVAGLGVQRARLERLADLDVRRRDLEARLAGRLADLGSDWTARRVAAFDLPLAAADDARVWRLRIEEADGAHERACARAREAAGEAGRADEAAEGLRRAAADLADRPARPEVEARRERLDALERRLPWLRAAPAWLALLLAASLSLTVYGGAIGGPAGWSVAALGALAALATLGTLGRAWARERGDALAAAADLGMAGLPRARDLDAARQRLRAAAEHAREREEAERRLKEASAAAERAARAGGDLRAAAEEAGRRAAAARSGWEDWRRRHGLPETLTPEGFATFAGALRAARETAADLRAAARQAQILEEAAATWREEARSLLAAAGRPAAGDDALIQAVDALAPDVAAAVEARRSVDELGHRVEAAGVEVAGARAAYEQALAVHGGLLAAAGAADDAAYDAAVAAAEAREGTHAEIRHLWEAIAPQLGDAAYGQRLRRRLRSGGPADWATERLTVTERLERAAADRDAAIETRARAAQRRGRIEQSADIAALSGREGALLEELAAAVRDWRRLRLAECLLDDTLGRFVRDRQPEVLAFASQAFRAVTGGRYGHVVQDAAAADTLAVIDDAGARVEPGRLSRGAEEQLYLSLRLGLAESFARRAASLPLVLDDALVNFDPQRAAAMMRAFAGYLAPGGRQLLLFTCHPEIRDLALRMFPRCPVVELAPGAAAGDGQAAAAGAAQ